MARDFDGVDDQIDFGSDAALDNMAPFTSAGWYFFDTLPALDAFDYINTKIPAGDVNATWLMYLFAAPGGTSLTTFISHQTTALATTSTDTITSGTWNHFVATWPGGTNVSKLFRDGVEMAYAIQTAPVGARLSDAAESLKVGDSLVANTDMDGRLGAYCLDNTEWTAAQINRARYWGHPGGTKLVYHPFHTTKLTNEGTATADGTPTGTTMISMPKVERCWAASMGCGR